MTVGATIPTVRTMPSSTTATGRPKLSVQRDPVRVGTNSAGSAALL